MAEYQDIADALRRKYGHKFTAHGQTRYDFSRHVYVGRAMALLLKADQSDRLLREALDDLEYHQERKGTSMNDEQIDAVFNTLPHSETSQLDRLMERVKALPPMTAEQLFEQRVSLSWSVLGDPKVTKDQVRAILLKRDGR